MHSGARAPLSARTAAVAGGRLTSGSPLSRRRCVVGSTTTRPPRRGKRCFATVDLSSEYSSSDRRGELEENLAVVGDDLSDRDFRTWQEIATDVSAEDPNDFTLLRRKGRLKEQDHLIDFMISMHKTHTSLEVMTKVQDWIREHKKDKHSRRGLYKWLSHRRRMLKYLHKKDYERYIDLVGKLGLKDTLSNLEVRR